MSLIRQTAAFSLIKGIYRPLLTGMYYIHGGNELKLALIDCCKLLLVFSQRMF